jgi:crotonobetainyl-CoA:carnitine CoA-transferase CaiB-like acyl-CoA transferase
MRLVGAGFRLEHGSPGLDREPPLIGEHTDEVLKEAGYGPEDIERFHREQIV